MTEAQTAGSIYFARLARSPSARFKPAANVITERDPSLPGVRFYRYRDGSVLRVDADGDAQAY